MGNGWCKFGIVCRYAAMLTVPLCSPHSEAHAAQKRARLRTEHGTYLKIQYEYVLATAEKIYVTFAKPTFSRFTPGGPIPLTLDFCLCVCEQVCLLGVSRCNPTSILEYLAGLFKLHAVASLLAFLMPCNAVQRGKRAIELLVM